MDLSTDPPTNITSALSFGYQAAAMCDADGELLFYVGPAEAWSWDHQPLLGGQSLWGSYSVPQVGLIIPWPGTEKYYATQYRSAFAPDYDGSHYYHVVDMSANGGMGEMILKNQLLRNGTVGLTAAVAHPDLDRYWLILHDWGSDAWLAYRIDDSGLDTNAVISHIGEPHHQGSAITATGTLKASPDGTKLALTKSRWFSNDFRLELFSFDVSSGVVSDPIRIADHERFTNAEFSPSGQFLYASNMYCGAGTFSELLQFDISSEDSATIAATRTVIHQEPYHPSCDSAIGHSALGIDGRIYVNVAWTPLLGVIREPDQPGMDCLYDPYGFDMGVHVGNPGMPNFIKFPGEIVGTHESDHPIHSRFYPNPFHTTARLWLPRAPHGPVTLRWHDAQGRLLHQEQHPAQQVLDLHRGALPGGLLLLSAHDARGDLARLKVVVE